MKKLFAIITVSYCSIIFSVASFASEEVVQHSADTAHGAVSTDHAAASGGGNLPQFEPTWFASQIFWLAISFAVLYFIFSKKTLPNISGVIENRKNHIQSDLETAEKLTSEADNVHDLYQKGLKKAQGKAAKAVQDVENDIKTKSATAFEEFRARSEKEVKAAEKRIIASKDAAMDEMNTIAAEAASVAVEKIIGTNADVNKVKTIVAGINGKARAA